MGFTIIDLNSSYTRADARRPIAIYAHFLTLSLKISANQVAMTLFLKISTKYMKSKPETLQNRFVKETFAKNRMSKALFVQKKIADGRTDRQTD